jgi:hypothetical protein
MGRRVVISNQYSAGMRSCASVDRSALGPQPLVPPASIWIEQELKEPLTTGRQPESCLAFTNLERSFYQLS